MHLFTSLLSPISHLSLFAPLEGNSPVRSPYTFHGVAPGSLTSAPEERLYVCPVIRHFVLSESGGVNPCRWECVQVMQLWGFSSDSRELSRGSRVREVGGAFGGKEAVEENKVVCHTQHKQVSPSLFYCNCFLEILSKSLTDPEGTF